ncbi:unnamed protein product [Aureobasidium mustum]|uniref:Uncharacterized protein n=1 Tax=Aureobasidium mustum TaxID=2773714 RepID=A0A9N8K5X4_9PEZI|nr:unnamed protein product [Aureobasidium mustum]
MSSPSKSRRRSSLSAAFDHFRNKCRRTRIDSLLSPPKLGSETSNDENDSLDSTSDSEGVPLTANSGDKSSGSGAEKEGRDEDKLEQAESTHSRCDSRLPEFSFDGCSLGTGFELGVEDSESTSPDEDKRLVSALADFTAEATEPEDFERYFALSPRGNNATVSEKSISPTGNTATAPESLQQEWTTQVQTEPQTQEQTLARSTYASLDEVVKETVLIEQHKDVLEEPQGAMARRRSAPPMETVDGVRLDARPLVRHSGTAAPPHSSLQLCDISGPGSSSLKTSGQADTKRQGVPYQPRPQLTSWFSSSSESSTEGIHLNFPSYRRRNSKKTDLSPPSTALRKKRHQTTHDTRPLLSSPPPFSNPPKPSDVTSAPKDNQADKSKAKPMEYSHTPPDMQPTASRGYTTLSSAPSISAFHHNLNTELFNAIESGDIKANRVGTKKEVRRFSGTRRSLQQGWEAIE